MSKKRLDDAANKLADLAEAKRKKRTSFGKSTEDYLPRIKLLLVAIFAPVILYAVVSLARDPALPTITKRLGRATLDRFATFLGPAPKYKRR